MTMSSLTLSILALALLSGCGGQVILLKNDKGEIAKCEVSQSVAMWFGVIARDIRLNDCAANYEKAGYQRIGN